MSTPMLYNYFTQSNTLNEMQMANLDGFMQQSPLIDILFIVFVVAIIFYLVWTRNK